MLVTFSFHKSHLHFVHTLSHLLLIAANEQYFAITKDMVGTQEAQAAMASALNWTEAKCDPALHAQLLSLSGGIVSPNARARDSDYRVHILIFLL